MWGRESPQCLNNLSQSTSCSLKNAAVNIGIYQGSIVQTCAVPPVLSGLVHSFGMQSFISAVDHYTALLCNLHREQWVFEQFLSTLKAALPPSERLLASFFCAQSWTRHSAGNTDTTRKLFSGRPLVFLTLVLYRDGWEKHAVELWGRHERGRCWKQVRRYSISVNAK